ncbi:MAG: aminotransferase class I/II-fold pyridoxal phosphate-dependent enzyme [Burkholderiaceae bacterium]
MIKINKSSEANSSARVKCPSIRPHPFDHRIICTNPLRHLAKAGAKSLTPFIQDGLAAAEQLNGQGLIDRHLRQLRATFAGNIKRITSLVESSFPAGTRVSRPAGGFVLWVQLPGRFDTRSLYDAALSEGICFAPGEVFAAGSGYRNCLRLSAGNTWNRRIEKGVVRLGELACAMPVVHESQEK